MGSLVKNYKIKKKKKQSDVKYIDLKLDVKVKVYRFDKKHN